MNELKDKFPDDADLQSLAEKAIEYSEQYKTVVDSLITNADRLFGQMKGEQVKTADVLMRVQGK